MPPKRKRGGGGGGGGSDDEDVADTSASELSSSDESDDEAKAYNTALDRGMTAMAEAEAAEAAAESAAGGDDDDGGGGGGVSAAGRWGAAIDAFTEANKLDGGKSADCAYNLACCHASVRSRRVDSRWPRPPRARSLRAGTDPVGCSVGRRCDRGGGSRRLTDAVLPVPSRRASAARSARRCSGCARRSSGA